MFGERVKSDIELGLGKLECAALLSARLLALLQKDLTIVYILSFVLAFVFLLVGPLY